MPAEVEASGHQRVRRCPQRRLPSGHPLTASIPARPTRTAWLLRAGPLGAWGRTSHGPACGPGHRWGPGLPCRAAGPQDLVGALFPAGLFCVHGLESQPSTAPGSNARGALSPRPPPPTASVRPRWPVAAPDACGPAPARAHRGSWGRVRAPRTCGWFLVLPWTARSPRTRSGLAPPDEPSRRALPSDRPGQPCIPYRLAEAARPAHAGWWAQGGLCEPGVQALAGVVRAAHGLPEVPPEAGLPATEGSCQASCLGLGTRWRLGWG